LLGGNYVFYQCTIANYWKWGARRGPALALNNYLTIKNIDYYWGPLSAAFVNCVIWGGQENEFVPDAFDIEGSMSFIFDHCVAKLDTGLYHTYEPLFVESVVNDTTFHFKSTEEYDFRLDTLSPARNKARLDIITNNIEILQFDLDGNDRLSDEGPDIGVYERVE
jgi:hypothetical protein